MFCTNFSYLGKITFMRQSVNSYNNSGTTRHSAANCQIRSSNNYFRKPLNRHFQYFAGKYLTPVKKEAHSERNQ